MDPVRFDHLVETLATPGSRRGLLGVLLGMPLSLLGLSEISARRHKPRRQRHDRQDARNTQRARGKGKGGADGKDNDKNKGKDKAKHQGKAKGDGKKPGNASGQGPCGNGSAKANECKNDGQCCTGICEKKKKKDKQEHGRCQCRNHGASCTEDHNCCTSSSQPMNCQSGSCQAVVQDQTVPPPPAPSPESPPPPEVIPECQPQSDTVTCAGRCDSVVNNCGQPVNCPGCSNPTPFCVETVCVADACGAGRPCPGNQLCVRGSCVACDVCQDPACSYATVSAAVDDPGGPNTIHVCAGVYEDNTTIPIWRNLSMIGAGDGDGPGNTILRRIGSGGVIDIAAGVRVRLGGLRITGGNNVSFGGGILHRGNDLTMTDCTVTGNTVNGHGGGLDIAKDSVALLTGCTIRLNEAAGHAAGIRNLGTLTLTNCEITGNTARFGGGIKNGDLGFLDPFPVDIPGDLTLDNTIVSDNSAETGAGIYNHSGTVRLNNGSQLANNPASFFGGGIANLDILISDDSTISGNTSNGEGGGVYNLQSATATLQNGSSVTGNTAGGPGGGGVYNDNSSLTLDDSSVSGNLGGGGVVNTNGGTVTLQNGSSISGNVGGDCIGC